MTRRGFVSLAATLPQLHAAPAKRTVVSIKGDQFFINGAPTYAGRVYKGMKIEGLLLNSRMVEGIFDDLNPETRSRWVYPDTKKWDPERNTREFVAAMPAWRKHGLLSFTINLQGGSPEGYSKAQPWENSAFDADGGLRPAYMNRLATILERADSLGMAPIVGFFYQAQDQRVRDESHVKRAVMNAVNWLHGREYRNVLIEIANECDVNGFDHEILKPARVHELIDLAKSIQIHGRRYLVGTSYGGGKIPRPNVVKSSDFLLLHGNGVSDPARISEMVAQTRQVDGYRPMPILFNEDDHFLFDQPSNNMLAAINAYASWGYFDPGKSDYSDGYQSPPVNWGINSERKKAFFSLVNEITGSAPDVR
jgi:hypothetical protein